MFITYATDEHAPVMASTIPTNMLTPSGGKQ